MKESQVKLNVGCGNVHRIEGYVHIDARHTPITDRVCDAWAIDLPPGSVSEIYSRHMLEHLTVDKARLALACWCRLLAPGGLLHVVVPDIAFHARQLLGLSSSNLPDQELHAMAGFYGWCDPERGGSEYDAHRWGWTRESLTVALYETGFSKVRRLVTGTDTEPWHLNLQAWR
ncbi:hypothetical protein CLD22_09715 [Rubrivivax gelatinosus]|nr:hypothetical protein [Rubrivivax gelatinosus]